MKSEAYFQLNKIKIFENLIVLGGVLLLFGSCCKRSKQDFGHIRIVFEHQWGDTTLLTDEATEYVNAAGNIVTFSDLEYFISNLTIKGSSVVSTFENPELHRRPNIHYIRIPGSRSSVTRTTILHQIPLGSFNEIRFTFGIDSTQNKTYFGHTHAPISPYREMFWPSNLGGGYHHMKLDGRWRHPEDETTRMFALHLGILRRTSQTAGEEVFLNYFPVVISRDFHINRNDTTTVTIIMDVKQWLEPPYYVWDFSVMSSGIMQREHAMDSLAKNGRTVFR